MDHALERMQPSDQSERERALDIRCSFIVEAPAGSGKTGLLMQRFLKLLAYAEIESPEEVVAITFTRKATAEMRERILKSLQAAHNNHPIEQSNIFEQTTRQLAEAVLHRSQASGWNLLEQPQRLNIRTIDSICAEITRSLPILSGVGGTLQPVENASELYQEAARQTLQMLGSRERMSLAKSLETILLHRDGNLRDCERLIADMLRLRDQWGRLLGQLLNFGAQLSDDYLETAIRPRLENALRECIEDALRRALQHFPAHALEEACRLTHHAAHVLVSLGGESKLHAWVNRTDLVTAASSDLPAWRALSHQLLTNGNWRKPAGINRNHGFEKDSKERTDFQALLKTLSSHEPLRISLQGILELPDPEYPEEQWEVAKALFHALIEALIQLRLQFAQTQQCDFTEIALAAQSTLEADHGSEDLARATGLRIQHLLIDEMQDTSISQHSLIHRITEGWDGYSQTLFLVGDPKQSIYLFRQARVELFQQLTQEGIGEIHLERLQLTANFRSQGNLVKQLNEDFSKIFPSDTGQEAAVTFTPATSTRTATVQRAVQWHARIRTSSSEAPAEEPQQDVQQILEILRTHYRNGLDAEINKTSIAVLASARTHLAPIARALREDNEIPFRAVDIEGLGEVPEVQDALALTRALLHPADRASWLSLLRSPVCGLTLAEIYSIASNEEHSRNLFTIPQLLQGRSHLLPLSSRLRAEIFLEKMESAQRLRNYLSLPQWIEQTWNALGVPLCLNKQQEQNIRAYFTLLEECESECQHSRIPIHADMIVQKLTQLYANPEPSVAPAVELMTIHRAKGLEWDIVIVPELQRASGFNTHPLFSWMELPDLAEDAEKDGTLALLAPIHGKGESSSRLTRWIYQLQKQREVEELLRVFYVACTRAREELHLFAAVQETKTGFRLNDRSLLKAVWPVAEEHFAPMKTNAEKQVLPFPKPQESANTSAVIQTLAAEAAPQKTPLRRLPIAYFEAAHSEREHTQILQDTSLEESRGRSVPQPLAEDHARAFGNAVHAFLEQMARALEQGIAANDLHSDIATWQTRIAAFYRAESVASTQISEFTSRTILVLRKTLSHTVGYWILQPHLHGACEVPLHLHSSDQNSPLRNSIRIDRIFQAGDEILSSTGNSWWVVDYKTSEPSNDSIEEFLQQEKAAYQQQLESYAKAIRMLHGEDSVIHLALYYPCIAEISWWKYDSVTDTAANS